MGLDPTKTIFQGFFSASAKIATHLWYSFLDFMELQFNDIHYETA